MSPQKTIYKITKDYNFNKECGQNEAVEVSGNKDNLKGNLLSNSYSQQL